MMSLPDTNNQLPSSNASKSKQQVPYLDPQVSSSDPPRKLRNRTNRDVPKPTYEPDPTSKVKYPMSNYVFYDKLSESNKSFVNQLSSVSIPNSVNEALIDPK